MNLPQHLSSRHSQGPFEEFLGDVAFLGVRPVVSSGIAYGMMRARSNARWWLLPSDNAPAARAGLAMYQPVSLTARAARGWITTAVRLGFTAGWASGRIRFGRLPRLPGEVLPRMASCAYFTGTDGPHRKTAIQMMDERGTILGYAKLGRRASVRPYLAHEARMLGTIAGLGLSSVQVPHLLAFSDQGGDGPSILVTDSRKAGGMISPSDPGRWHERFLLELFAKTGCTDAGNAYRRLLDISGNHRLPGDWSRRFVLGLNYLAPRVSSMPVALAHGDFTPWNCFILGDRLYVFDWEYADADLPVGYDLVHYMLATASGGDPAETIDRLLARVRGIFAQLNEAGAVAAVLMSLLCHAGFYLRRLSEHGRPQDAWEEGAWRGQVVDALLGRGA